jgi:hypothetical protein
MTIHTRVIRRIAAVVLLLMATDAFAQDDTLGLKRVYRSQTDAQLIFVGLETPLPGAEVVALAGNWEVRVHRSGQSPGTVGVATVEVPPNYAIVRRVNLRLSAPIPTDALRVEVTLLVANQPSASTRSKEDPLPTFEPVDDPDDATFYFNGVVAPAVGAHTLYTIDARADIFLTRTGSTNWNIVGAFKADERKDVDPDSAKLGVSAQRIKGFLPVLGGQGLIEFDRDADVVNAVAGASVIKTWHHSNRKVVDKVPVVTSTVNFQAGIGIEAGANLRNTVDVTAEDGSDGSGGIFRLVPGASLWWVKPMKIDRLVLAAEYLVRIPATREIFLETRDLPDDADPVASLTKKARHHVTASATFMINEWFGFEAGYEFGSLPPVFQIVDHSFKFGITFMGAQNSALR